MASNTSLCEALFYLSGCLSPDGAGELQHFLLDVLPSILSRLYHCPESSCPSLALFLWTFCDETRSLLVGRAVNSWAKTIETREMVVVASATSVTKLNMAVRRTVFVESLRRTERFQSNRHGQRISLHGYFSAY
ncbi:hypothetical protein KC317_g58 [Hortaea werneckii]|nr:hypothetical protein KC317_g58 [Hortaea werneckii]